MRGFDPHPRAMWRPGSGARGGTGRTGSRACWKRAIARRSGWSIYEVSDYLGCGSYGSRVVPEVECSSPGNLTNGLRMSLQTVYNIFVISILH